MKTAFPFLLKTLLISIIIIPAKGHCQNITGIWRGYFISDFGEQYKYELQIEQTKSSHISGVSYSYLDTRFYGKALLTGNFTGSKKSALIQEVKTVEVKSSAGSETCIMKCLFTYAVSGKEEFLEGTYSSTYENNTATDKTLKGIGCGGGKVILRKVETTDFYVEPFLRKNPAVTTETPKPEKVPKPLPGRKPMAKTPTKPLNNLHKDVRPKTKDQVKSKRKIDSIQVQNVPSTVILEKPLENTHVNVPVVTRSRKNELVETINVGSRDVYIRLYDNGEIDDDTISVYLDGKPLTMNRRLSTVPINLTIHLDDNNTEHTLIMYAENMGRIPPNTSLMIIQDGDKRYQVNITSTEQKNAMVRFRYQKKSD